MTSLNSCCLLPTHTFNHRLLHHGFHSSTPRVEPPTMRRGLVIFLVTLAVIVLWLLNSVSHLLALLFDDGSADAIHKAEIPAPGSPLIDNMPQYIPKVIHQTYINESVPEHWREAQTSCIDLHEDYEYKVRGCLNRRILCLLGNIRRRACHWLTFWCLQMWTDAKSREFIATEYPWFLKTFDNYSQPIQRADAIRYFVLAHFGGIYIDLDDVSSIQFKSTPLQRR